MPLQSALQLNRTMSRLRAALQRAERQALEAAGRADDAEYLANLSLELDATNDPRVISEHVAGRLNQLIHADQICISFGTVLRGVQVAVLHGEGPPQFEAFRHQRFLQAEGGVLWERIESGEVLFIDDYPRSPTTSPFMLQAGVSAVAHLPFGRLDGEVGVLTAFRFSSRPTWTAQERTLLEATGRTLGHAVQRAQQVLELDQAMRFSKAIAQVARLTELPRSLYETARRAAEIMAGPARLDFAALAQVNGGYVSHRVQFRSAAVSESAELIRLLEQGLPTAHSLAWRCLQQREALFIDGYPDLPGRVKALLKEDVRALAFVPLTAGDPSVGLALVIGRVGDSPPWSDDDRELFLTAAQSVRLSHERQDSMDRLREAALTDPLTRLGNRRALEDALELALDEAGQRHSGLSVITLDLDGLKAVNDQEGHDRGDALLADFAASLRFAFRGEDALFRVGGDEFVVIVRHPSPAGAALSGSLARIQVALQRLREHGFEHVDVSAGMATFPDDRLEGGELLRLSDQRMYLQKQQHRAARRR
ncbi:sensor domain-containing diguanylate cyclase (plasmid) [Deinococcus radiomollis]|uniref:GGDEF domain-containing protein n=1 Tax=Deinococcus radiomollis TaxID=468916 RepID=UPI0038912D84